MVEHRFCEKYKFKLHFYSILYILYSCIFSVTSVTSGTFHPPSFEFHLQQRPISLAANFISTAINRNFDDIRSTYLFNKNKFINLDNLINFAYYKT